MANDIIMGDININPLLKAKAILENALKIARSDLEKTGAVKCFEYCYELSWKIMRKILLKKGIETSSPRDAFREAGINKLIDDSEIWFDFIKKRNLTSHTYDEALANEVFEFLPTFQRELDKFINTILVLKA